MVQVCMIQTALCIYYYMSFEINNSCSNFSRKLTDYCSLSIPALVIALCICYTVSSDTWIRTTTCSYGFLLTSLTSKPKQTITIYLKKHGMIRT